MKLLIPKTLLLLLVILGSSFTAQAAERTPPIPQKAVRPLTGFFTPSTDDFVSLLLHIDKEGNVVQARVRKSTDKRLEKPSLIAIRKWKYMPATKNGEPAKATIVQPIHFGSGRLNAIDKKAVPVYAPLPEVDERLASENAEVSIAINIDSAGYITKINPVFVSDERFRLPVLDAIREWSYEPARRKKKAVSSRQIQTFVFGKGISPSIHKTGDPCTALEGMSINPVMQRGLESLDLADLGDTDD